MNRTIAATFAVCLVALGAATVVGLTLDRNIRATSADDSTGQVITSAPKPNSSGATAELKLTTGELVPDGTSRGDELVAVATANQCVELDGELVRREEMELTDWTKFEIEEISEEELETVELDGAIFDDRVADPAAPTALDFSVSKFDVRAVADPDLLDAVERCFDAGLFVDETDENDETEDDTRDDELNVGED